VDDPSRRAAIRASFEACNAQALPDPEQGHGLGRRTMPETMAYSAVMAVHTLWLFAQAPGLGFHP
jgi:5,6-dimethylbenzimidazole synthase